MQRTDTSSGIRMAWYRVYHGMPYDPKFAVIAKRCGAKRGDVVAVWLAALDFASQHKGRGSIEGIDAEEIAVSLEYETEYVSGILRAFEDRGMIASSRLAAWERRQVQREREDNSTERVRAYRQRQKGQPQATEELVYRRGFFCPKSVDFGTTTCMKKLRCVLYARVSTKKERGLQNPETQIRQLREFAAIQNGEVAGSLSTTKAAPRPSVPT